LMIALIEAASFFVRIGQKTNSEKQETNA
jgi:hypothetical protein